mgnify:CR=1 FL=1
MGQRSSCAPREGAGRRGALQREEGERVSVYALCRLKSLQLSVEGVRALGLPGGGSPVDQSAGGPALFVFGDFNFRWAPPPAVLCYAVQCYAMLRYAMLCAPPPARRLARAALYRRSVRRSPPRPPPRTLTRPSAARRRLNQPSVLSFLCGDAALAEARELKKGDTAELSAPGGADGPRVKLASKSFKLEPKITVLQRHDEFRRCDTELLEYCRQAPRPLHELPIAFPPSYMYLPEGGPAKGEVREVQLSGEKRAHDAIDGGAQAPEPVSTRDVAKRVIQNEQQERAVPLTALQSTPQSIERKVVRIARPVGRSLGIGRDDEATGLEMAHESAAAAGGRLRRLRPGRQRGGDRGDGGGGHAVHAGAGLGDDAFFTHAPRQQDLADAVVNLVGAGVVQRFALEVDLGAAAELGQAFGVVQRAWPSDVVALEVGKFFIEGRIELGRFVFAGQVEDQRHQGFRHVAAAE